MPYMNVRFEKNEHQAWEIKSTKYEEICETAIRELFKYGLTAKEIQWKLKECYDKDISLASLSKLLLGLGLRRNRFHKRKKGKSQN